MEFFDWSNNSMGGKFGYSADKDTRIVIQLEKGERLVGLKRSSCAADILYDLQFIIARKP
jgi:hypothetical protein